MDFSRFVATSNVDHVCEILSIPGNTPVASASIDFLILGP